MDRCRMCGRNAETRNINLYVIGSEGLDLCQDCYMQLVGFVRGKMREYAEVKRSRYVQTGRNEVLREDSSAADDGPDTDEDV